ncbi:MAG: spore maturation protein [Clostridia bacterium]|nr:spore maturation protein [Clostridia bacterium]
MKFVDYVIPFIIILLIVFSTIKRKNVYEIFVNGAKEAIPLIISIFPYIIAIYLMVELFKCSGLLYFFTNILSPLFDLIKLPKELTELLIIKPFSGSGSIAILDEIFKKYGVNSYISLVACCLFGSSETIFYISAIYFVKCKNKKVTKGILISIVTLIFSTIITSFLCKFIFFNR